MSKQSPVFGRFLLFSQNIQPDIDLKYRNDRTKRLKENISSFLAEGKLRGKK